MKRAIVFPIVIFLSIWIGSSNVRAGQIWSNTSPEINLSHIFEGVINKKGKPTGFHARPGGMEPSTARISRILSLPNSKGVYSARVEIYDQREKKWKMKFSTFFPDSMQKDEVIAAILHAYKYRVKGKRQPWRGPSGHGFQVQGYLNRRGNINTAFPVYTKN